MQKWISRLLAISIALSSCTAVFTSVTYAADSSMTTTTDDEGNTEEATPEPEEETGDTEEATDEPIEEVTEEPEDEYIDDETGDDYASTTKIGDGVGAAGGTGFYGTGFSDTSGHWAEQIILECTNKNYLDGYEDGSFRPDDPVTAAEFAKIYSAWSGNFYIISNGYWAMPYIRDMVSDGIFENGDYSDYQTPMTREMVAKAVVNSLSGEYFPPDLSQFEQYITDIDEVDESLKEYVLKAYIAGIMTGYEDGSFNPKDYVTRAEILTIINRAKNENERTIPEAAESISNNEPETQTYYSAAVSVRKSTNANNQNFRLYGKNAQYMTEDDPTSGLKIYEEFQGAQGMAFLMRYDLTDILKREDSLNSIKLIINRHSNGDMDLGLFWYDHIISDYEWNSASYMQVVNGSGVAGDDKTGYNTVVDNISAILPTWGDMENAVPQEEKTQPFAQASLNTETDQYVFELDIEELKEHMDENNIVEIFSTSVNYDRYGLDKDNKPRCYSSGELAPQLYCEFEVDESALPRTIELAPSDAELMGGMMDLETGDDGVEQIANFQKNQSATFTFKAYISGTYKMTVYYAANQNSGGGTALFTVNGTEYEYEFAQTGSWTTYVYEDVGEIELTAGTNTLTISDKDIPNTYLINIRGITLEKVE